MGGGLWRVTVNDPEHKKFVEDLLRKHPPGNYLIDAEGHVGAHTGVGGLTRISFFIHDYMIALLRGDEGKWKRLRETYPTLAGGLRLNADLWHVIEEEPLKYSSKAAQALFDFYSRKIRVEGWRNRIEEDVVSGLSRGLDAEPSIIGDKFRAEYGRWINFLDMLDTFEEEARERDRVALWVACEVGIRARMALYNEVTMSYYPKCVLREILSGNRMRSWEDEALWLMHQAAKRASYRKSIGNLGSLECEDLAVSAVMAARRLKPVREGDTREIEKFLSNLEVELFEPGLLRLYREAKFGPEGSSEIIMMDEEELTEERRETLMRQREASRKFLQLMVKILLKSLNLKPEFLH